MNKPKKLIRSGITALLKDGEWEHITDQAELNRLYALKIKEELAEIEASDHKDIMEFVDLIQVCFAFAAMNGLLLPEIESKMIVKIIEKGSFSNIALNNLNPSNPSNTIYFESLHESEKTSILVNALEKIKNQDPYTGRAGCTYGDTDFDSVSVGFGQTIAFDITTEIATDALIAFRK